MSKIKITEKTFVFSYILSLSNSSTSRSLLHHLHFAKVKSIPNPSTMSAANDVSEVSQAVLAFLDSTTVDSSHQFLKNPTPIAHFADIRAALQSILSNANVPSEFEENTASDESTLEKIKQFNSSLGQQWQDFVLRTGLTKTIDALLTEVREAEQDEKSLNFEEFTLSPALFAALNKMLLLLDLIIALAGKNDFPSARSDFYQILAIIVESLTIPSTDTLEMFWYALESRQRTISDNVFDQKVTLDRISMLGICNGITDKYYRRGKTGKYDSYQKDTFNDKLHARVRTFLSELLLLDDLTGLNKYYSIANRVNKEPHLGVAKTGDDELLRDILQFHRLLRDPYSYLKNPRMLSNQVDSLDRLYGYLLDEEAKYAKKHPSRDIYQVKNELLDIKKAALAKQYQNSVFFAENYWLSPFEEIQRGQQFDSVKAEDQKVALRRFDSSKYRRLLLLQMYLVSSFFLELQSSRKRSVLQKAGAAASTKHISEDSTPELLVKTFAKIKREIPSLCRAWDTQLSFLLQHISQSEEFWWSWLLWGKNKQRQPLLGINGISPEESGATVKKFDAFAPYKSKRYFNTHATPQLSRKMRTKTGLSLLEVSGPEEGYDERIEELSQRIANEHDENNRLELEEKRSVLLWKKAKSLRSREWLLVGEVIDPEMLGVEEEVEEKKDELEEKDGENVQENKDEENMKDKENMKDEEKMKDEDEFQGEDKNRDEVEKQSGEVGDGAIDELDTEMEEEGAKELREPTKITNYLVTNDEEMADMEAKSEITSPSKSELAAKDSENAQKLKVTDETLDSLQTRKRAKSPEEEDENSSKKARTE